MAYDEDVAHRVRELIGLEQAVSEQKMFGGLAFLVHGNLAVAVSGRGMLLVRVGPQASARALASPHAHQAVMGGREMPGWIYVAFEGVRTRRQLSVWVRRGTAFAATLPPKGAKTPRGSRSGPAR
jgi:TfoX/Sxy family transcriptional regulator of competence genes